MVGSTYGLIKQIMNYFSYFMVVFLKLALALSTQEEPCCMAAHSCDLRTWEAGAGGLLGG